MEKGVSQPLFHKPSLPRQSSAKGLGNTLLHIPKPMSENPKSKSFGWPFWLVLTLIVFLLAGLTAPMTIRCRKKPEQTEATSNLRQIGLALFEFETEYGSFPSQATVAKVTAEYPDHGLDLSGKSSNSLFRRIAEYR